MNDSPRQVGGGRASLGDIGPKFAALTDDVFFDDLLGDAPTAEAPSPSGGSAE